MSQMMKIMSERPWGVLPSTTDNNLKERINAISIKILGDGSEKKDAMMQICEKETTSCVQSSKGKETTSCDQSKKGKEVTSCDLSKQKKEAIAKPVTPRYRPPISFPQRLLNMNDLKEKGKLTSKSKWQTHLWAE